MGERRPERCPLPPRRRAGDLRVRPDDEKRQEPRPQRPARVPHRAAAPARRRPHDGRRPRRCPLRGSDGCSARASSMSRASAGSLAPSLSCRLVAPVAERVYVQWPELAAGDAAGAVRRHGDGHAVIFVTIGTSEPFERLLRAFDDLAGDEELVIQAGRSRTRPARARCVDFLDYDELARPRAARPRRRLACRRRDGAVGDGGRSQAGRRPAPAASRARRSTTISSPSRAGSPCSAWQRWWRTSRAFPPCSRAASPPRSARARRRCRSSRSCAPSCTRRRGAVDDRGSRRRAAASRPRRTCPAVEGDLAGLDAADARGDRHRPRAAADAARLRPCGPRRRLLEPRARLLGHGPRRRARPAAAHRRAPIARRSSGPASRAAPSSSALGVGASRPSSPASTASRRCSRSSRRSRSASSPPPSGRPIERSWRASSTSSGSSCG